MSNCYTKSGSTETIKTGQDEWLYTKSGSFTPAYRLWDKTKGKGKCGDWLPLHKKKPRVVVPEPTMCVMSSRRVSSLKLTISFLRETRLWMCLSLLSPLPWRLRWVMVLRVSDFAVFKSSSSVSVTILKMTYNNFYCFTPQSPPPTTTMSRPKCWCPLKTFSPKLENTLLTN